MDNDKNSEYTLYIGEVTTESLMTKFLESAGENDSRPEKDKSQSCICALKLDKEGKYIAGTLGLSSFVWAFSKLIDNKNLADEISNDSFENLREQLDDYLIKKSFVFDLETLKMLISHIYSLLKLENINSSYQTITVRFVEKQLEETEDLQEAQSIAETDTQDEDEMQTSTDSEEKPIEMLPSFYINDINMIKDTLSQENKIIKYVKSFCNEHTASKTEIDIDICALKRWTLPNKYPLGKWPSKFNPSLMQQVAINISVNEDKPLDCFSVNGPPSTGKTTLLKEIIASNVVQRAKIFCELDTPNDLFERQSFDFPPNEYRKNYYVPDQRIVQYGMIVASNNNATVENISIDLPKAKDAKNGHTNLFDTDVNADVYFSDIATELLETESAWGLISASGGAVDKALFFLKANFSTLK